MSRAQFEPVARASATQNGVPVEMYLRQITQESGWNPSAVSPAGAAGIAQLMPGTARDLGVDPFDAVASLHAAARYMKTLYTNHEKSWKRALAAYNWGWGNVAAGLGGRPRWDGRRETLPAETRHYLDVILGDGWPEPGEPVETGAQYNADAPVIPQPNNWACSTYSLLWALRSLGRGTTAAWLQQAMLDQGVVTMANGLERADGFGLVSFVDREYNELGIEAFRKVQATIDDVRAKAGTVPVLIGGRAWNHWSGVRSVQPDGTLNLANPADGWGGIKQELRDSWDQRGWWTMVWLQPIAGAVIDPDEPIPHEDSDLVTSLQTALAEVTKGGVRAAIQDLRGKPLREVDREVVNIGNRLDEIAGQFGV